VWRCIRVRSGLSIEIALQRLRSRSQSCAGAYALRTQHYARARLLKSLVMPIALPGLATALHCCPCTAAGARSARACGSSSPGIVVFTLPFMVRSVAAVAGHDLRTMEEGAASLGASSRSFLTIVLRMRDPNVAGALRLTCRSAIQPDMDAAYARHQTTAGRIADAYARCASKSAAPTPYFLVMTLPC